MAGERGPGLGSAKPTAQAGPTSGERRGDRRALDLFADPVDRGAVFSRCSRARFELWMTWAEGPRLGWLLKNPSLANEERGDPTWSRMVAFTKRWGFAGLHVFNPVPFVASDPEDCRYLMERVPYDPDLAGLLAENLLHLQGGASKVVAVLCGWGNYEWTEMAWSALANLSDAGLKPVLTLGLTAGGDPKHPLARGAHRVPDDAEPRLYNPVMKTAGDVWRLPA